jgi:hypothetical protein
MKRALLPTIATLLSCAAWFVGIVGLTCSARAQSELELTWSAEPPCPDRAWVTQRITERLGSTTTARAGEPLRAEASVTRGDAQGFVLQLHTERGDSAADRAIEGARCDELAEAAVLIIALMLEQDRPPPAPTEPAPVASEPPATTIRAAPAAPPAQARPVPTSFFVRADLVVERGYTSSFGLAPQLAAGYDFRWLRAELAGFWLAPRTVGDDPTGGQVRVSLWALRPTGCARLWGTRVALSLCAGLELGQASGRGVGLVENTRHTAPWLAATAAPRIAISLTRNFALNFELGAAVPFRVMRFVSLDAQGRTTGTVYTAAPISGRATLGGELRF